MCNTSVSHIQLDSKYSDSAIQEKGLASKVLVDSCASRANTVYSNQDTGLLKVFTYFCMCNITTSIQISKRHPAFKVVRATLNR